MSSYKNALYQNKKIFRRDLNYLGLEGKASDFNFAKTVILPVPYDSTTSIKTGTRGGPLEIIKASYLLEDFDIETNTEITKNGIHTLNELEPCLDNPKSMIDRVQLVTTELYKEKKFTVMLGGEHTISVGAVVSAKKYYPDLSILQLDAHVDMRSDYENTPYNHACAARRMIEYAPITQVGIRCIAPEELKNLSKFKSKLHTFLAEDINLEYTKQKNWIDKIISTLSKDVYLTIDLDALDPSIMPAVGCPLPGGLAFFQTLRLLKRLFETKNVVSADVVEYCPMSDNIAPAYLAASLVNKIISYKFLS
jgi:agmatinase